MYKSRPWFIALLIIDWSFVILCSFTGYWWGLLFFGLCAVVATYPLLDPGHKIIFFGSKAFKTQTDKEFKVRYADEGIFTYTEDGFILQLKNAATRIPWSGIRAMFGYKVDLYAIDQICLDVFFDDDLSFKITEETPGWYIFLDKIAAHFPSIQKGWHIEISVPAFETSLTLIYERENRTLEQATELYYAK